MHRIETMGVQRVIEVDCIEFRLHRVAVIVVQKLIHHPSGQVRIFVVIDKHRIAFLHHLAEERTIDAEGFS